MKDLTVKRKQQKEFKTRLKWLLDIVVYIRNAKIQRLSRITNKKFHKFQSDITRDSLFGGL